MVEPRFTPPSNTQLQLRLTPYAWEKLIFMRDSVMTEISALAVTDAEDLLLVHDLVIPRQEVTSASTKFDRSHLAELTASLADPEGEYGLRVDQFMRIWVHTHPGMSPTPSPRDMETFYSKADFGAAPWGVMLILGAQGKYHCAYRFIDAGGKDREVIIPMVTADGVSFPGVDDSTRERWAAEISERVKEIFTPILPAGVPGQRHVMRKATKPATSGSPAPFNYDEDDDWDSVWVNLYDPCGYANDGYSGRSVYQHQSTTPRPSPPRTEFVLHKDSQFYLMEEAHFLELVENQDYDILPDTLSEEVIGSLERCNIYVVGVEETGRAVTDNKGDDEDDGEIVFQCGDGYYPGAAILQIDAPQVTKAIASQLAKAEGLLMPIVEERNPAIKAAPASYGSAVELAEPVYDGFGNRVGEVFHWVTQAGVAILVSEDEFAKLKAVASGRLRAESIDFGIPVSERVSSVGAEDDNPVQPPALSPIDLNAIEEYDQQLMEAAWESVQKALAADIQDGIPIGSRDSRLVELEVEASDTGWDHYFAVCEAALRGCGYSPSSVSLDDLQALFETKQSQ